MANTTSSSSPSRGGRPKRLTYDSADDHVTGWSPDSQHVLFNSGRHIDLPYRVELYSISINGGQVKQVSAFEGRDGVYSPKGDLIAYVRGPGHLVSQGLRRLLQRRHLALQFRRFEQSPDHHPQGGRTCTRCGRATAKSIYYVSDCAGGPGEHRDRERRTALRLDRAIRTQARPRTCHHAQNTTAFGAPAWAPNGESIVYECGPDIWIHSLKDGKGRRLKIEVNADDKTKPGKHQDLHLRSDRIRLVAG